MMNFLVFNTATPYNGVALFKGVLWEECIWLQGKIGEGYRPYRSFLAANTREILCRAEVKFKELDFLAVTTGPGSFTGVRSALSFVKGLALASNLPVVPLGPLESLAWQAGDGLICPLLHAKRNELYWGLFNKEKEEMEAIIPPASSTWEEILSRLPKRVTFIGLPLLDGLALREEDKVSPPVSWILQPRSVGELASVLFRKNVRFQAEEVLPLYLRGF